jgi:hypothetical protein
LKSGWAFQKGKTMLKFTKIVLAVLAVALLAGALANPARADVYNKKTVLTFSNPVEIPGRIMLPAGKYIFKLHDSPSRNIVQIWNSDESKLITTILTIYDYRLTPTDKTVIEFSERPATQPNAVRAWFYPGETIGREFVYPKSRAAELAQAYNVTVPAEAVEPTPKTMESVPLVAVTPEAKEEPLEQAIQTTPPAEQAPAQVAQNELPKTAGIAPLVGLLGMGFVGISFALKRLATHIS